jgi:hypothetical protein
LDRFANYDGIIWFLVMLVPLFFIQRRLHFETQAVLLLVTRRVDISTAVFAVLFFPGVLLHEFSHFITARALGVRTHAFSIFPATKADGNLQLGYVETVPTDFVRDAMIGAAPLAAGGLFVTFAGMKMLGMDAMVGESGGMNLPGLLQDLSVLSQQPDFWVWFYLIIAVSATMMPSASDRRAWPSLVLFILVVTGVTVLAGAGPWLEQYLVPWVVRGFRAAAIVFAVSFLLQLLILLPVWGLRMLISRVTRLRVV